MSERLWQLRNVGLTSHGHDRLCDVTLDVSAGVTAVLGESGAGKTTLINLLVGFEKPTAGRVVCQFDQVGEGGEDGGRPVVFWSPQDHGLWPHLTVGQHLEMVVPQGTEKMIPHLLEQFDLDGRSAVKPGRLSQGERARLAVARAMATSARILVMDEPLAHVDVARSPGYWETIQTYVREHDTSWIFATHDPATVLAYADRVICLNDGRVLYQGDIETLYRDPPGIDAARCLGQVNWFEEGEAGRWLLSAKGNLSEVTCLRPEQLDIRLDPAGLLAVESYVFHGPVCHVQLKHATTQQSRKFVVRSPSAGLKSGDRVVLTLDRKSVV